MNQIEERNNIISDLQKYTLNESVINNSLCMKINKIPKKNINNNKKEINISNTQNKIFIPCEKDMLFWCFYVIKNGNANYEMLNNKNIIIEKKIKIEYVEKIRNEKQLIKPYKISSLANIEDNLANDYIMNIKTFLTLCVIENINVLFIKKRTFYELLMNDGEELYIVYLLGNGKYGFEKNTNNIAEKYKSSLFKIDNIDKPIKSFSS